MARSRIVWYGFLLALVAAWSFFRLNGVGLFGGDSLNLHLVSMMLSDGQIGLREFLSMIGRPAVQLARFQMVLQLPHGYLMYLPSLQHWWIVSFLSALMVVCFFSLGVGRQIGRVGGALVFLMIMAGMNVNLDAHPLALWPIFIWGLATLGIGLFLDMPEAGFGRRTLAALAYFLAPCCGNESMLAPLAGLVLGRVGVGRFRAHRPWGAAWRGAAAPLAGGGLFLLADLVFRHCFPSHYDGSMLDLSHPLRTLRAWGNATLSGLPAWDFARLEVVRFREFNVFIYLLCRHAVLVFLVGGFVVVCAALARVLAREDRATASPATENREWELAIAMAVGFLLNMAPVVLSQKYADWFTSPYHGFYYTYSFDGYACFCAGFVLVCRLARRQAAMRLLVLAVAFSALTSGLSSQYFLGPLRWETARWRLWERFVGGSTAFLPSRGAVHIVAPQFCQTVLVMAPSISDPEPERGLNRYFSTRASLLRKAGKIAPDPALKVEFLSKLPAARIPGDRYYYLYADHQRIAHFGITAVLHCAEVDPDWKGEGAPRLHGPLWVWLDSSFPHPPRQVVLSWTDLSSGAPVSVVVPYLKQSVPLRVEAGSFSTLEVAQKP